MNHLVTRYIPLDREKSRQFFDMPFDKIFYIVTEIWKDY